MLLFVLKVVDVDNDERVCDPREIGRLLVAGPQFAAATANTMNGAGIASSSSSSTNVEKFIKTSLSSICFSIQLNRIEFILR